MVKIRLDRADLERSLPVLKPRKRGVPLGVVRPKPEASGGGIPPLRLLIDEDPLHQFCAEWLAIEQRFTVEKDRVLRELGADRFLYAGEYRNSWAITGLLYRVPVPISAIDTPECAAAVAKLERERVPAGFYHHAGPLVSKDRNGRRAVLALYHASVGRDKQEQTRWLRQLSWVDLRSLLTSRGVVSSPYVRAEYFHTWRDGTEFFLSYDDAAWDLKIYVPGATQVLQSLYWEAREDHYDDDY